MSAQSATGWDVAADRFDEQPDHGLLDPVVRRAWRTLLADLLPPAPARILDVGCGTGSLAVLLAERGYDVAGVDLSPRMVALAKQKAQLKRVSVDFQVGDAEWLAGSGPFDVILARHLLWAFPDVAAVMDRWATQLARPGRFVLVEGFWHTDIGLHAEELLTLVGERTASSTLRILSDEPDLWGGPVTDERYAIVAQVK